MDKMIIEKINELEYEKQELNEMVKTYERDKIDIQLYKIELKYSPEYNKYKTVKEKEERATLEVGEAMLELQLDKLKIDDKRARVEAIKYELDFLLKTVN